MIVSLVLVTLWLAPQDASPIGRAPDGAPGFGSQPELRSVESLFRTPEKQGEAFVDGLHELIVDVRRELAQMEARARRRGLLRLAPARMEDLRHMLTRAQTLGRDPFTGDLELLDALALIQVLGDGRVLIQGDFVDAALLEIPDLLAALGLLRGHTFGLVALNPGNELAQVAARADLAAARLRALLQDLRAMRVPMDQPMIPASEEMHRMAKGMLSRSASARTSYFKLRADGSNSRARIRRDLHLTRFDKTHASALSSRNRARRISLDLARRLPQFLPIYDSQRAVPATWASMKAIDRARLAVKLGTEALHEDPLNTNLCYLTALALEFASGPKAAEPYLDRFLALHGIRYYEHRTFQDRDLDRAQEYALLRVAGWKPSNQR